MKTTPVCSIFISLIACAPMVMAQAPADGGRPKGDGDHWKKVDQDGDGAISLAEFSQMPRLSKLPEDKRQALFDRLDKNGDGKISRPELHSDQAGADDRRLGPPNLKDLDKNSDGAISFEEFQTGRMFQRLDPERQRRIFSRLDSNGDGKITPQDKPPHRPRPDGDDRPRPQDGEKPRPEGGDGPMHGKPGPRGLIEHLDKDGDGSLSFEEFRANPRMQQLDEETARKRFQMMDRNRDGKVDRSDIQRRDGNAPGAGAPRPRPEVE